MSRRPGGAIDAGERLRKVIAVVVPGRAAAVPPPGHAASRIPVRARLAIAAGRVMGAVSRLTGQGEGGVIGGKVALVVDPELIATLGQLRTTVVVSGTNGKTTTTHLLSTALGATSSTGANLRSGLAAALIARLDSPTVVLEVDEMVLGDALATAPRIAVLLNLSRDQLDRVGEPNIIMKRWRRVLQESPPDLVVANADDPQIVLAGRGSSRPSGCRPAAGGGRTATPVRPAASCSSTAAGRGPAPPAT